MKALVYTGIKELEMQERPIPEISGDEYLIKVIANGICGSDVEGYLGKSGRRIPPMVMGHEFSGIIERSPSNGKYQVGQKVTAFPKFYCGKCEICRQGLVNICPQAPLLGAMDFDGTMMEYIKVPEKYVIPFDNAVSYEAASLVEPLAVAVRGAENIPTEVLKNAKTLLVIGAGTIGLLLIQALRLKGYKGKIFANDQSNYRLKRSLEVGADGTFTGEDFEEEVAKATDNQKFDAAIECVGITPTAQASLNALKSGGTAVWIGNNHKMIEINMQQIVTSEIKIFGSYTYTLKEFKMALDYIEQDKILYAPLITSTLPLDQGVEAFGSLLNNKDGKEIKIVLMNE